MTLQGAAPVAVVVVTWNSAPFIEPCLESLTRLRRRPRETVVVDNASTDDTLVRVRARFPEVRCIEQAVNVGFCRANNLGIAATSSPYVLVLNPDTRLEPDFLERLLPALEDPHVGIVSGKLLRFDGQTIDSAGQRLARSRQPVDRGYGHEDRGQYDRDEEVFGACGAAALYRREMIEAVADAGGEFFDERFFAFYEDLDVAWRARRLGYRARYVHRAVVLHARGGTAREPGPPGRFAATLRRPPEVRFHIAKNRYLTILRNDSVAGYLANLPFILSRDIATFMLLLVASPGVLVRLWHERRLFWGAIARRRLDAGKPRHQT